MAESIGAAVFTVDADISRLDSKLTEAQNRATAAVAGINSQLQRVQGADVVINKVGTLNLSQEIAQIEAYKAQLASLRGQLSSLQSVTPAPRATMLASGRATGYDAGSTMTLENYNKTLTRIAGEVTAKENQLAQVTAATTAKIKEAMAGRVAAIKSWQTAMHRVTTVGTGEGSLTPPGSTRGLRAVMAPTGAGAWGAWGSFVQEEMRGGKEPWQAPRAADEPRYRGAYDEYNHYIDQQRVLRQKELALLQQYNEQASIIEMERNIQMKANLEARNAALQASALRYKEIQVQELITTAKGQDAWLDAYRVLNKTQIDGDKALQKAAENRRKMGAGSVVGMPWEKQTMNVSDLSLKEMKAFGLDPLAQQLTRTGDGIKRVGSYAKEADGHLSGMDRAFGRLSRTLFAFVGVSVFVGFVTSIMQAIAAGVEFNKTLESVRIGMAALMEAQGKFSQGGMVLSGAASLNASLTQSSQIIKQLQYDNLKTIATFEQLAKAYQSALSPGLAAGFNLQQVRQFTLAMVQAASAMQLPLDMMAEELRSMLRGTITPRNTIIATNLGITNEDIRKYKGDANALFSFIMGKLSEFTKYGPLLQQSFAGVQSNLVDVFKLMSGEAGKDYFDFLKGTMSFLTGMMADLSDESKGIQLNPETLKAFRAFYDIVELLTAAVVALGVALFNIPSLLSTIWQTFKKIAEVLKEIVSVSAQWIMGPKQEELLKADQYAEKLKFIDEKLKSINASRADSKMYMEDLGLGIAPSWSDVDLAKPKEEKSPEYYQSKLSELVNQKIDTEQSLRKAKNWIDAAPELSKYLEPTIIQLASDLYDLNNKINEYADSSITAAEKAHELARQTKSIGYAANEAQKSIEDLYEAMKKDIHIDIPKMGEKMEEKITRIRGEIEALESGVKRGTRATSAGELAEARRKMEEAREWVSKSPFADPLAVQAYNEARDIEAQAVLLDKLINRKEDLEDQQKEREKAGRTGRTSASLESLANEMRALEREKEQWNQKFLDMDHEHDQKRMQSSGQVLQAEIMNLQYQAKAKIDAYDSTIKDLEAKVTDLGARNIDERARAELERQAQILDYLKGRRQEYVDKIEKQLNLETDLVTIQQKAQKAKDIADLQLEYAELAGTKEEILQYTLAQIDAEAALRKIEKPQEAGLIEQIRAEKAKREAAYKGGDFTAGFSQAAADAAKTLPTWGERGAQAFEIFSDAISDTADTLTEFLTTGEASFSDFANSVIKNMVRIMTQQMLMSTALSIFGFLTGGAKVPANPVSPVSSGWSVVKHDGTDNIMRMVPDSYFFSAPRLHDGLAADEYPAILQKGETVIPKNQSLANTSNITVNITQNGDGGSVADAQMLSKLVAKAVDEKIQQNFQKQMRNGGVLDKYRRAM